MLWRGQLGRILKLFRWINQTAYLVSVPFLMILLLGATVRDRPMAIGGATMVVLLNIARLISGIANLAVIPLRDGIDLKKMKKPIWRLIEPVVTIALVVLAFTFIPSLSGAGPAKESIRVREASARSLGEEIEGKVSRTVEKAKKLDINLNAKTDKP